MPTSSNESRACFWPFFLFSRYWTRVRFVYSIKERRHTSLKDVLFLCVVVKRTRDPNFSRFFRSSTAPSLKIEPYVFWTSWNLSGSSSAILVKTWIKCLTMMLLSCFKNRFDWRVSRDTFSGKSSAAENKTLVWAT